MNEFYYRKADISEIDQLVQLRKDQLIDEGIIPDKDIDEELISFFHEFMSTGKMVEWIVEYEHQIIATAAIVFYQFPPTYTNKSGIKGYVTNMYTHPQYRHRGIATNLLDKLIEEAKGRNVEKVWLGASKLGRPVYLKFGFKETNEWLEMNDILSR